MIYDEYSCPLCNRTGRIPFGGQSGLNPDELEIISRHIQDQNFGIFLKILDEVFTKLDPLKRESKLKKTQARKIVKDTITKEMENDNKESFEESGEKLDIPDSHKSMSDIRGCYDGLPIPLERRRELYRRVREMLGNNFPDNNQRRQRRRCPSCRRGNMVRDSNSGDLFCSRCGYVDIHGHEHHHGNEHHHPLEIHIYLHMVDDDE